MNPEQPVPPSAPAAKSPAGPERSENTAATDAAVSSQSLTPEEQMALFEKELKETDWGHQPC